MIKCHLSRLMGERKLKIADLARDTGINRGTATRLYYETAERIDIEVINALCHYFECSVGDCLNMCQTAIKRPARIKEANDQESVRKEKQVLSAKIPSGIMKCAKLDSQQQYVI